MNSKLIVFFAIVAAVFAEELKIEVPEPEKYPAHLDKSLCPDYPNCDNVLLHTPTVDVERVKSITIKSDIPTYTIVKDDKIETPIVLSRALPGVAPLTIPYAGFPGITPFTYPSIAPYAYSGFAPRYLYNGLW